MPVPELVVGYCIQIKAQDTVTSAPEFVSLTGNLAFAHTDAFKSYLGKILVYGGHTISIAFAKISRALPNKISLIGWQGCDHLATVHEEDILENEFLVSNRTPVEIGGDLVEINVETSALRKPKGDESYALKSVLDWRLVVWLNV